MIDTDNRHETKARHSKAYRIARVLLLGLDVNPPHAPADWVDAPRELRERVRVLAKVRRPSDGSVGVSDATWTEAIHIAASLAETRQRAS